MATTQKIRNDIAKTKEKIAEQQKRLRALEAQLAEEENLEIVRMVKAVKMDNKELTAFLNTELKNAVKATDSKAHSDRPPEFRRGNVSRKLSKELRRSS